MCVDNNEIMFYTCNQQQQQKQHTKNNTNHKKNLLNSWLTACDIAWLSIAYELRDSTLCPPLPPWWWLLCDACDWCAALACCCWWRCCCCWWCGWIGLWMLSCPCVPCVKITVTVASTHMQQNSAFCCSKGQGIIEFLSFSSPIPLNWFTLKHQK